MNSCGFIMIEVTTFIETVEKRTVSLGGTQFGSVVAKKIQELNYWLNNCIKRVRVPAVAGFDAQALLKSVDNFSLYVMYRDWWWWNLPQDLQVWKLGLL